MQEINVQTETEGERDSKKCVNCKTAIHTVIIMILWLIARRINVIDRANAFLIFIVQRRHLKLSWPNFRYPCLHVTFYWIACPHQLRIHILFFSLAFFFCFFSSSHTTHCCTHFLRTKLTSITIHYLFTLFFFFVVRSFEFKFFSFLNSQFKEKCRGKQDFIFH